MQCYNIEYKFSNAKFYEVNHEHEEKNQKIYRGISAEHADPASAGKRHGGKLTGGSDAKHHGSDPV